MTIVSESADRSGIRIEEGPEVQSFLGYSVGGSEEEDGGPAFPPSNHRLAYQYHTRAVQSKVCGEEQEEQDRIGDQDRELA